MSQSDLEHTMLSQPRDVLPASQYLQERLQERRARNTRPRRSRHTDFGPQKGRDDDIFLNEADEMRRARMYDSSPLAAPSSSRSSDAGNNNRRRALGVRDMDTQLDRLSKQNFALKLELDHRREQTKKLQDQVDSMQAQFERAEMLEDEHKELLKINSQMVAELENRDKAVEEAMDIIFELEEKLADAEKNSHTRPSTANADSGYAGTESQENEASSSPQTQPKTPQVNVRPPSEPASAASQRLQGMLNGQTPMRSKRESAILSQKRPSTNALRSVYMASSKKLHPVKSFQSLLSRTEARAEEEDGLSSPRLSVLSESSFPSLYSAKKQTGSEQRTWENEYEENGSQIMPRSDLREDSIKRVSQWISERDMAEVTPSKSNHLSTPLAAEDDRATVPASESLYQSLNDALISANRKSATQSHRLESFNPYDTRTRKPRSSQPRPTSFAGPIFGEALLPPTPESASTRMLRASRSSIADDRSLLDVTPAVAKGYDALPPPIEPGLRTAPRQMRSSVELRTALASNMEFRSHVLEGLRETEAYVQSQAIAEDDRSEIVDGYGYEDDDFPDGKSIHMGTPRRLLKRSKPPVSSPLAAMDTLAQTAQTSQSAPRRRRSSDQYASIAVKPRLSRFDTSPVTLGSSGSMAMAGKKCSAESMTSPHSVHSNSSGNRTVVPTEDMQRRAMSPESLTAIPRREPSLTSPTHHRPSPSPARTLSQKTATLFRRMSNSHGSDPERGPFSILMSGPNSSMEPKRPRTSQGHERPTTSSGKAAVTRPPSRGPETHRPSLSVRTKTEPATARAPSAASEASMPGPEKDKKSIFRRANSVKTSDESHETGVNSVASRRRGSIREAVTTARRPWR